MRPRCAICDRPISPPWWVCNDCERAHGLEGDYRDWPAWAQALVSDEKRNRRRVEVILVGGIAELERLCDRDG